jgi:acetylornithine/N-succinyldiaminopimelate aminotransferase
MAVANAVLDVVLEPGFLETVQVKALRLKQGLAGLKDMYPDVVEDVRGMGLLTGLKLRPPIAEATAAAFDEGLLVVGAAGNVLRILPPLNVEDAEIADGVGKLARAFAHLSKTPAAGG